MKTLVLAPANRKKHEAKGMALHYILDGYNIIKQSSSWADKSLEAGRDGLIRFLINERPQGSPKNQVTVVFDGRADFSDNARGTMIRIFFTSGETADDFIKRLVSQAEHKKNIVVVTDDRQIQFYVRPLGANILSVQEFLSKAKSGAVSSQGRPAFSSGGPQGKAAIPLGVIARINEELKKIWLK